MEFERRTPDEIIEPFKKVFKAKFLKSGPLAIVAILVVMLIVGGAFYTIQPNEVGLVLRFGKFVKTTKPGLHLKIPLGIEKVHPVKVEYIYKDEFGFRTRTPGIRSTYDARSYDEESLMLTGDLNVLDLEWIVQFKIKEPFKALFVVRNVRKTLRDLSEAVMRQIVGNYTFTEVLTTKRIEVNIAVQEKLQKILDSYNSGIQIVTVKLQDVNPPNPVKPAFNEVNEAKQEKEKLINQAWQTYNQKIPQARGEALKMVTEAEGYALAKINTAQGDANRFTLLQKEYARAKNVTRRRLYLESMSEILKKAKSKYIIDPEQKGILPLLQLEK